MQSDAIGLDIGGANLKVATASGRAITRPFELWKHPERLAEELAALAAGLPQAVPVGVTMTGELCDCFATKRDGVRHILAATGNVFGPNRLRVWSTAGSFLTAGDALDSPLDVAAANWHALATYAGRFAPTGPAMLIDVGSTTTDIVPLLDGEPAAVGRTDAERMRSGELVYTGARRTPVCAILGPRVAAEFFATTLDVYLRLRLIPEEPAIRSTADSRPATAGAAHARLARMLGGDSETTSEAETEDLAREAFATQRAIIVKAMHAAADRLPSPPRTIIIAGSGECLAQAATRDFSHETGATAVSLADDIGRDRSDAACAYAVAVLAAEGGR